MDQFGQKRAMRANRMEAKNRGVAALIDIGSSKIACIVLSFDLDQQAAAAERGMSALSTCRVVGYASSPSQGITNGGICGKGNLIDALSLVLAKAQDVAKLRVDHVFAAMSGGAPVPLHCFGSVTLENETASEKDISRALRASEVPAAGPGREYLHAHPINFSVDHRSGIHDPRGEAGNRLSVDLQLISVDEPAVAELISAIESCNVEVAGIAASPYVSGLSTLVAEEHEAGSACVDIGAGTTGISIFYRKHMVHMSVIRVGGEHITADISNAFGISAEEAERLKIMHGSVMATRRDDRYICEFQQTDGAVNRITRTELIGVIKPRVEEILEDVAVDLDKAGFTSVPGQSIVLTGGCVHLLDLDLMAKSMLGRSLRFGRPVRLGGLPQAMTGPEYSTAVGLCLHAAQPQDEYWDFPSADAAPRLSPVERTVSWLRKNW